MNNQEMSFEEGSMEDIEGRVYVSQVCDQVCQALTSESLRKVFSLMGEGLNQAEIAEILEISPSRVGQLVFQIKSKVVKTLGRIEGKDYSNLLNHERTDAQKKYFARRNGFFTE
jgi:DNA-directed RNA polymerase specialized sigma24 family protein